MTRDMDDASDDKFKSQGPRGSIDGLNEEEEKDDKGNQETVTRKEFDSLYSLSKGRGYQKGAQGSNGTQKGGYGEGKGPYGKGVPAAFIVDVKKEGSAKDIVKKVLNKS